MKLQDLLPAAIIIGVAVIGITVMAEINQNIFDSSVVNSSGYNVSENGLVGMQELGQ